MKLDSLAFVCEVLVIVKEVKEAGWETLKKAMFEFYIISAEDDTLLRVNEAKG